MIGDYYYTKGWLDARDGKPYDPPSDDADAERYIDGYDDGMET